MPQHRTNPCFVRVKASENSVVLINLEQYSSIQIVENGKIKVKKGDTVEEITTKVIRFFLPTGTGLTYAVGVDISSDEFDYLCSVIMEYMYLSQAEFIARQKAKAEQQMDEWKKLSEENQTRVEEPKG